ncbi:MAG: EAL domain-containing protein [Lachnospiraceae bacterium]|nr:EAL domain-containing protein [Lachnospiraceae bacterium]MBQ9607748.1 EAL domain-containing protein [Lachnospiraceae bacterium]MBR1524621.1 EAL domain-containing protein [Lachnospiraceae bacterium]
MTNAESFLYNYTPAGDILTIFISVILLILMYVSYIKKEENYLTLRKIPVLLIFASVADILIHLLIPMSAEPFSFVVYALYLVYYINLILALYLYMIYIKYTMQVEIFSWGKTAVFARVVLVLAIIAQAAAPFLTGTGVATYVFLDVYTIEIGIICFMIYRSREHVYGKILWGIIISTALAFLLMYAQLFFGQTSYTAATFLFPAIAVLYLMHSNPYDFALGTVDAGAFEDMVAYNFMKRQDFYLMSLYLHDFEASGADMPRAIQNKVRYYGEKLFRSSQLFRISGGHLVLVFDPAKNPSYEEKGQKMLDTFYKEYETHNIDYKIVYMASRIEISSKNDYLTLLQYLHAQMGENTVKFVTDEDIIEYSRHGYILDELKDIGSKKDLNDPRVLVFCQPVLNTRTGQYDTAEALMRLKLPETGMVFPDQFIPLAERHGLIHTLSLIILAKTCAQIKKLIEEGYYVKRISVNFSMIDVREPDFAAKVKGIISIIGIPFEKVAIEITESQNERDFLFVKERLNELRDSGIKFYLDDFGTGYSSFERIMELPFDIIKFDRSLTVASGVDVKTETMVSYLAHMFTDMNYSVLYEGIEDENDEERCIAMFARYLQGYKYSKPIPIEQLTDYFVKS